MALTIKNVEKTCKGKLTVYMKKGKKTTETVWCSRSEVKGYIHSTLKNNESMLNFVTWNGKIMN